VALLAFVTSVIAWDHTAYGIEEHKSLCLFCLLLISALVNTVCCLGFEVGTFVVLGLFGLDNEWSLRIIKQVGNYGESYKRNIADTGILPDRGPNELWTKGGILYVPPAR
jgi:hypothetical protein